MLWRLQTVSLGSSGEAPSGADGERRAWPKPALSASCSFRPLLVTCCLPFFDGLNRVDQHQDVQAEVVPLIQIAS